ncbi:hypothetical protein [Streptomyces sp. NPDC049555]|uniref:hypothetical protein n=1 Tax=unclassified Streptomyces TaxID=2593676 RepID=UPI003418EFA5
MTTPWTDHLQLEAFVKQFELADRLGHDAFGEYAAVADELDELYLTQAQQFLQELDPDGAAERFAEVVRLNETLLARADRELARPERVAPDYRTDLIAWRAEAADLAVYAQGEALLAQAMQRRLSGDLRGAVDLYEQAQEQFGQLAEESEARGELGELKALLSGTDAGFCQGVLAMGAGAYQQAREIFRQVRATYQEIRRELADDVPDVGGGPPGPGTPAGQVAWEVEAQLAYADMMFQLASFFDHVRSGHPDRAEECICEAVGLYEEWMNLVIAQGCAPLQRRVMLMELSNLRGWQGWVRADVARERRDWQRCREHLTRAEQAWSACADLSARLSVTGRASLPFEMSNIEMLLETSRRRYQRERELWQEIERLTAQLRAQGRVEVHSHGGYGGQGGRGGTGGSLDMSENQEHHYSTYNFPGANVGAAGDGARAERFQQFTGLRPGDFRHLAEELEDLAVTMGGAATDETQRAAVRAVRAAAEGARSQDESAVRRHLRAAGAWALDMAARLGVSAAEAAVRSALGG